MQVLLARIQSSAVTRFRAHADVHVRIGLVRVQNHRIAVVRQLGLGELARGLLQHTGIATGRHGLPANGRTWVFVEQLLMQMLIAQSNGRTRVADFQEPAECRSIDERTPPTGGSKFRSFLANRNLYNKALGLPTDARCSKSTTDSRPLDGSKSASA